MQTCKTAISYVYSKSMDPIVHFEIPVDDVEKARTFYSIFGWKMDDWKMPDGSVYVGIHTTPIDEKTRQPLKPGAINGGVFKKNEAAKNVKGAVVAIHVESIDERLKEIEKAGGKVVMPKIDMMGMGFYAYFADLSGNVIGLWQDPPKK